MTFHLSVEGLIKKEMKIATAFGEELCVHGAEGLLFDEPGWAFGFEIAIQFLQFCPRKVGDSHQMIKALGPPINRIFHVVEFGILVGG